ncbi:MAG TPA: ChaB family protein [Stellaceae bacterium]|nr:ChaB family protein [Stellaceae bacterium]
MPYARNADLPAPVRNHLPAEAQEIYREAFNHAWDEYGSREPARREEIAHRVAWSAVKRKYYKADGQWLPIEGLERPSPRRRRA